MNYIDIDNSVYKYNRINEVLKKEKEILQAYEKYCDFWEDQGLSGLIINLRSKKIDAQKILILKLERELIN